MSIDQLKGRIPDFAKGPQAQLGVDDGGRNVPSQSKYGLLLASAFTARIQDNAGSAAHELAWQSACGQSRFRVIGAGSKRNQWVRCLHGCPREGAAAIRRQLGHNSNGRALCRDHAGSCGCDRGGSRAGHTTSGGVIHPPRTFVSPLPGAGSGGSPYPSAEFAESTLPPKD